MTRTNPIHVHAPHGRFKASFDAEFRRSLRAFLDRDLFGRRGISASGLGRLAVGNPGFVRECLARGGDVQLNTADKVRRLIGETPFRARFCRELERFMQLTGTKPWVIGWCSVRNASFVHRLQRGGSPYLSTVDRVRIWMHGQLRDEQRRMVFAAVPGEPSFETGRSASPAPAACPARPGTRIAVGNCKEETDERPRHLAEYPTGRRAVEPEPEDVGALPGHGRGTRIREIGPRGPVQDSEAERVA